MSEPVEFSRGPWRLAESKGGQWFVYARNDVRPFKPHVKLAKKHTKLERANANLIAAAPDLYWSLRECLEVLADCDFAGRKLCLAALAKADGR